MMKTQSILWPAMLILTLLGLPFQRAVAQTETLNYTGTKTIISLTSNDFVIPQGTGFLTLELKGGDGGDIHYTGTLCDDVKGGKGATLQVSYPVGPSSNQLQPGGLLRVFVGQAGGQDVTSCLNGQNLSAGGGGSSAVLYQAPGQQYWSILTVAGGGGGACRPIGGTRWTGQGGNTIDEGDDVTDFGNTIEGGLHMGIDYLPNIQGHCPSSGNNLLYGIGWSGGSVSCGAANSQKGANMVDQVMNATGSTTNSAAGYVISSVEVSLLDNSSADATGGFDGKADGGDGFTGGSAGDDGGGGGGGSSGGAALGADGGGGGGSWISAQFPLSGIVKTEGGDGAGSNSNGFVKLTTALSDIYVEARCKPNPVLEVDVDGNARFSLDLVNDGSIVPAGGEIFLSLPGGVPITGPLTLTDVCSSVGQKIPINLTAKDQTGIFTDQCSVEMTVLDLQPPGAQTQDVTLQLDASGNATLTASQVHVSSSDNCGGAVTMSLDKTSFTCADVGTNIVQLTVTDQYNNSDIYPAIVTVLDTENPCNEPPVAVCKNLTVQLSDNCEDGLTIAEDFDGGSSDPDMDDFTFSVSPAGPYPLGTTAVILTVTDSHGGFASCEANVTVVDGAAPTALCKQLVWANLDANGQATVLPADLDDGSTDNCGGLLTFAFSDGSSKLDLDCSQVGTTSFIELVVSDASNNQSTCFSQVSVQDTIAPVANCKDVTIELDANGQAQFPDDIINDNSTDNCGLVVQSVNTIILSCANIGSFETTFTAMDRSGNTSSCKRTITIVDKTPPIMACQELIVQLDGTGSVTITPSKIDAGSYDQCGGLSLSLDRTTFSIADVGKQIVKLIGTDNYDNSASCTATVEVLPPVCGSALPTYHLPSAPVSLGNSVDLSVSINLDCAVGSAIWDLGDGSLRKADVKDPTFAVNYTYTAVGLYEPTLRLTLIDGTVIEQPAEEYIVIYSDENGYITGKGMIQSPFGAWTDSLEHGDRKGHFAFFSEYQKGKSTPDGYSNFILRKSGFNFQSTTLEWMVVSGFSAKLKGEGIISLEEIINGERQWVPTNQTYEFMMTITDGDLKNTPTADEYRMKIWIKGQDNGLVYDNVKGEKDNSNKAQPIEEGEITIHEGSSSLTTGSLAQAAGPSTPVVESKLRVAPNPFQHQTMIQLQLEVPGAVRVDIFNLQGQLVRNLEQGTLDAGYHQYEWDGADANHQPLPSGMYLIRWQQDGTVSSQKVLLQRR